MGEMNAVETREFADKLLDLAERRNLFFSDRYSDNNMRALFRDLHGRVIKKTSPSILPEDIASDLVRVIRDAGMDYENAEKYLEKFSECFDDSDRSRFNGKVKSLAY